MIQLSARLADDEAMFASLIAALAALLSIAGSYTYTTLAGASGSVTNSQDGVGAAAQFDAPRSLALDRAGTMYVADTRNNTKIGRAHV